MRQDFVAPCVHLVPVSAEDEDRLWSLVAAEDARGHFFAGEPPSREAVANAIRESLASARTDRYWRIVTSGIDFAGLVGARTPSTASLALRAIGWRSLELVVALHPRHRRRGLATAAIELVAGLVKADGMTFALVADVAEGDQPAIRLLQRCGFEVLGRRAGAGAARLIYERAL